MKVHIGTNDFIKLDGAVVTSGTFDGVHLGHQKILNRVIELSKKNGTQSVLITFHPHPRSIIQGVRDLYLLTTIEEKIEILEAIGLDHLLIIPFNREFSELSSTEFIQKILVDTIGTGKLVIGYDHRFGKNREGGFDYLKSNAQQFGFEIEEISRQDLENVGISSSKTRSALLDGDVFLAQEYLGRAYHLSGTVVKGKQIGRTIGFPTANIQLIESEKLVPANGVYAVTVNYDNAVFGGVLNIGNRPTVDGILRTIEVNIFDFDKEIYGEKLSVNFVKRIRNEVKFENLEALKKQIERDKIEAIELLKLQ
jgi:riboflavin kinase/FMN adenylyltransferase